MNLTKRSALLVAACALGATGCKKSEPPPPVSAAPAASTAAATDPNAGHDLVATTCLSCHSEHMLAQQRLTQAQWSKVVTKMIGWGATLQPSEEAPLVTYLASHYGPDAGAYDTTHLTASAAADELAVLPDDPFPKGDAARGKALFADKCAGCHGPEAKGSIGVLLVDRPFLYRAADFAATVRKGRGKMTPVALSDGEIGDVLAHLRALTNAPVK